MKVMVKKSYNQKGMTLIEVLLSIVIISIILTSFAGFFSQSAIFIKKNENKLSTSQTAQKIVNLIEVNVTKNKLANFSGCTNSECTLDNTGVELLTNKTVGNSFSISAKFEKSVENLILVKVSVADNSNPDSFSETFTYIRR
ncbi:prepilin-type N-terminal cleavage/methylation domain-containing protein [Mesobacillus boroniphilus]|uniref:Prepilin-type N-terminal cleavage/methylation domain-containing protein n=1 Tax=Mesobacillus boroniphilus TaxID=308892 RepID=A0A944GY43_9BACI|nr:prepilin-type N-terminal cleavage/methylation domain-containing protein [Mesobacillus boroniphilus]MBS8265086.1 prepilin-type N-terminal cleavage/methylation domain-containing protein [Mesobacillus boroniphilus]